MTPQPAPNTGARTLQHPGPVSSLRINSCSGAGSRHFRLRLEPGRSLFDALVQPLAKAGVQSAGMVIFGGYFERLDYCVGQVDPTQNALFNYAAPRQAGAAYMMAGNATLGKTHDGLPAVHCHAALRTQAGEVKGGHIVTEASIIGARPLVVLVTAFDDFELRVTFDAETNISLFQPQHHERVHA